MKVCSICQRCYDDAACSCSEKCLPTLSAARDGDPLMIDGYRLVVCLRSTPNVDLYRAHELSSGRSCVIKVISVDNEGDRSAFLKDAKIAAGLFHHNLVD